MTTTAEGVRGTRYSWGGDDAVFVELDEAMSLEANFRVMAITRKLRREQVAGVFDICPANASYQVRYDPDVVDPHALVDRLRRLDDEVGDAHDVALSTRIVEIPVFYQDPWTHETQMRFRDRHQNPNGTDIEFAARVNGLSGPEAFVEAHSGSPWFASMVGFVAGLPFLYQMVPRERQLEVPKYLRPRTDTPALTIGHGGCFGCIYSVRGAGGYQMFGITPAPIYDPTQQLPDFSDFVCFFRPGDIVKFTAIDRAGYDEIRAEVEAGRYRIRQRPVEFSLQPLIDDPDGYNATLLEVLRAD
jgi:urea carboxylase